MQGLLPVLLRRQEPTSPKTKGRSSEREGTAATQAHVLMDQVHRGAASSRAVGRGRVPEAAGDTRTARAPGRVARKFGGGPGQQGSTVSTQQGKANNGDIQQPERSVSGQGSERLHNPPLWDTEAHPWPPAKPLTQAADGKGTEQTSSMPAQSHRSPSRSVAGRGQVLSGR